MLTAAAISGYDMAAYNRPCLDVGVLVRRLATRDEEHAREAELLRRLLRRPEVPHVDRIERAAVDADARAHSRS